MIARNKLGRLLFRVGAICPKVYTEIQQLLPYLHHEAKLEDGTSLGEEKLLEYVDRMIALMQRAKITPVKWEEVKEKKGKVENDSTEESGDKILRGLEKFLEVTTTKLEERLGHHLAEHEYHGCHSCNGVELGTGRRTVEKFSKQERHR